MTLVQLTVGKVDAGVAILLTPEHHLLEFPALLLPPDIETGSLVDISVSRNYAAEKKAEEAFQALQDEIYEEFGNPSPVVPVLTLLEITPRRIHVAWDNGVTYDPTNLHLLVDQTVVHTIPLNSSLLFAAIPIHGEHILEGLSPGSAYRVHLRFTTDSGTIFESNVVEASTVAPLVDPSAIPLPDSPRPKDYPLAISSPEPMAAADLHDMPNAMLSSMESLDLSDSPTIDQTTHPLPRPSAPSEKDSGTTKVSPDADQPQPSVDEKVA